MTNLPAGMTPAQMQQIAAYLKQQDMAVKEYQRPTGILEKSQIRGVNPRYQYEFQEYPKALTPPPETVTSESEERTLRSQKRILLPWDAPAMVDMYYRDRKYPVKISLPQVIVQDEDEEARVLASWNVDGVDRVAYPRYLFHPTQQPKMVRSVEEEQGLGTNWFATIAEAAEAAGKEAESNKARNERLALMQEATKVGAKFEPSWGNKRIQEAIDAKTKVAA